MPMYLSKHLKNYLSEKIINDFKDGPSCPVGAVVLVDQQFWSTDYYWKIRFEVHSFNNSFSFLRYYSVDEIKAELENNPELKKKYMLDLLRKRS